MEQPKVDQYPFIPEQAFLYFPKGISSHEIEQDIKTGEGKQIRRFMFDGGISFDQFENNKLKQLDDYIKRKNITLNSFWNKALRMRFHQSTGYDIKQTIIDMEIYLQFVQTNKVLKFTPSVKKCLEHGIFYFSGRDEKYRPILVFDIGKMIEGKFSEEQIMETQIYFFQWVCRSLLIPGQVQNWVAIIDVGYYSMFSLIGPMKKSISFLSSTYRNRMFITYLVRCPSSVYLVWKAVKNFLHQATVKKLKFLDQELIAPLLQFTHPSQLQVKYGGTKANLVQFWPLKLQNHNYKSRNSIVQLATIKQYKNLYKNGKLKNKYVKKSLVFEKQEIIQTKTDLRRYSDNKNILRFLYQNEEIIKNSIAKQIELPNTIFKIQSPLYM